MDVELAQAKKLQPHATLVIALAVAALALAGCGDGGRSSGAPADGPATAARATVEAAATAGRGPTGVISTPAPNLHEANKSSLELLRDQLATNASLGRMFAAIDRGDVDGVFGELAWQDIGCGGDDRGGTYGAVDVPSSPVTTPTAPTTARCGELIPAEDERLVGRNFLEHVVSALVAPTGDSVPSFVARSAREPSHYLIGYDLADVVLAPVSSDHGTTAGGIVFDINTSAPQAVHAIELTPPCGEASETGMARVHDSSGDLVPLLVTQSEPRDSCRPQR